MQWSLSSSLCSVWGYWPPPLLLWSSAVNSKLNTYSRSAYICRGWNAVRSVVGHIPRLRAASIANHGATATNRLAFSAGSDRSRVMRTVREMRRTPAHARGEDDDKKVTRRACDGVAAGSVFPTSTRHYALCPSAIQGMPSLYVAGMPPRDFDALKCRGEKNPYKTLRCFMYNVLSSFLLPQTTSAYTPHVHGVSPQAYYTHSSSQTKNSAFPKRVQPSGSPFSNDNQSKKMFPK